MWFKFSNNFSCCIYLASSTQKAGHLILKLIFTKFSFDFSVFEPYKDGKVDLLGPKLLFIALNLGGLALGVWKVRFFFFVNLSCKLCFLRINTKERKNAMENGFLMFGCTIKNVEELIKKI